MYHKLRSSFAVLQKNTYRWIKPVGINVFRNAYSQQKTNIKTKDELTKVRNIGIIAHVDAGKTTTCERMLYYTHSTKRVGDVDRGDTVMDYLDLERQRGITITSAAISFHWRNHTINLIDTPGHVDFTVEVERSVRVLDGAVTILDAVAGVQAQTETVWNQATRYGVPRVVYVNKMDRDGASFNHCLSSLKNRLYVKPFPIQMPVGSQRSFGPVVDLLTMELIEWSSDDYGYEVYRSPAEGITLARAKDARENLVEMVAEHDDVIMEMVLSDIGLNVPAPVLKEALRRITLSMKGVVVLCGSSLKNKGVQPILDSIVDFLPSPLEKPLVEGEDKHQNCVQIVPDPNNKELCALAFKVIHDHRKGMIVYFRVYSGVMQKGLRIWNSTVEKEERPIRICRVYADDYEDIDEVETGDIAAAIGLKHTRTGDTLVACKGKLEEVTLKGIKPPQPVYFCSVIPDSPSQEEALNVALRFLQLEDPSFTFHSNKETGQLLIGGMGELHLEIIKDRLIKHYKVRIDTGELYIAYRSSVINPFREEFVKTFTVGGKLERICITFEISKNSENKNIFLFEKEYFVSITQNRQTSNDLIEAIRAGVNDAFDNGAYSGFPFHDLTVQFINVKYDKSVSLHSYRNASAEAVSWLARRSTLVILEPIMEVKIQVDTAHLRNVLSDLTSKRRGLVTQLTQEQHIKFVNATVPLKELSGYSTDLRSFTKGTGFFSMEFQGYAPTTTKIQQELLQQHGYRDHDNDENDDSDD